MQIVVIPRKRFLLFVLKLKYTLINLIFQRLTTEVYTNEYPGNSFKNLIKLTIQLTKRFNAWQLVTNISSFFFYNFIDKNDIGSVFTRRCIQLAVYLSAFKNVFYSFHKKRL